LLKALTRPFLGFVLNPKLKKIPCFGVAGNFTGHLEQAGEDKDFLTIKTKEAIAPKAIFPTFIPCKKRDFIPSYLKIFPFSSNKIFYPKKDDNLQMESECGLICKLEWESNCVTQIKPIYFCASNDFSIRKDGAKKISEKKNWGKNSKGISKNLIPIDEFSPESLINDYRIASYIIRENQIIEYGENSFVKDYSYMYEKLILWMIEKFNEQKDEGPAENINSYLNQINQPEMIFISIGATRYTDFGEHNYLKKGDKTIILLYPHSEFSENDILELVKTNNFSDKRISVLCNLIK
jgi:hypothetical protein